MYCTSAGLLSPPLNLGGYSLPNNTVIHLKWNAPPSLDLTGIDPDMHFEISVQNNMTGQRQNFIVFASEYMYIQDSCSISVCQKLDFSVRAVNAVGKSNKTTTIVAFHAGKFHTLC